MPQYKKLLRCPNCKREHTAFVTGEKRTVQLVNEDGTLWSEWPCECGEKIRYNNDIP